MSRVPRSAARPASAWCRAIAAAALLAVVALAGCSGERPTLAEGADPRPTGVSSTTTTATVAGAPAPQPALPGPDTMLGYIATPVGEPLVYEGPDANFPEVADIGTTTSAGAPTTFAVVGDPTTTGTAWIQVLLPTRPNGATGWVPALSVAITRTPLRVVVDLEDRSLRVEDGGSEVLTAPVAIGTPENPTPVGPSYVTELIQNVDQDGAYGPYAFGLAMHSDTLTEFNGGPGQVGIHGTNQPNLIGQAVSHGCVRLSNEDITRLLDLQLPLGVPVFVT